MTWNDSNTVKSHHEVVIVGAVVEVLVGEGWWFKIQSVRVTVTHTAAGAAERIYYAADGQLHPGETGRVLHRYQTPKGVVTKSRGSRRAKMRIGWCRLQRHINLTAAVSFLPPLVPS